MILWQILRAKQNQGRKWTGIDAKNTKIADMLSIDVVEPIAVKEQIIKSATEAACMILRIDDVIAVSGAPGAAVACLQWDKLIKTLSISRFSILLLYKDWC